MVELNQQIGWVPAHVRDGAFGKWLEGARDWSVSRNRFWGTPIPVWKSDDPAYPRIDVYGSLDELERDFGVRPSDLHRPTIDELTRPNPDDPTGRSTMRRVSDVLDCWFDSGSMPFAQMHYPFENRQRFEDHFPADFIVEYVSQTRGWFYTLHVLGTALFDRPPFLSCIAHGILLGDDGRKLSKRLKQLPRPRGGLRRARAPTRCAGTCCRRRSCAASMPSSSRGRSPSRSGSWRTRSGTPGTSCPSTRMPTRCAGASGPTRAGLLDRYVLAKARQLVEQVTAAMDAYDLAGATSAITAFLDALTNWYVRRSRDRFWRPAGTGATGRAGAGDGAADGDAGRRRGARPGQAGRLRHLAHGARRPVQGGGPVSPLLDRGRLPRPHRRAKRPPAAMAASLRPAGGPRAHPGDGPGPGGLLGRPLDPKGGPAPCPPSPPEAHRRRRGRRVAAPSRRPHRRRAEREDSRARRPRSPLSPSTSSSSRRAAVGPRLGPRTQQVLAAARAGAGRSRRKAKVFVGGVPLLEGEYILGLHADRREVVAGTAGAAR